MTTLTLQSIVSILSGALITATVFALLLLFKAINDYTTAGPELRKDILDHFRLYAVWALGRLTFWAFLVALFWCAVGALAYLHAALLFDWPISMPISCATAAAGLGGALVLQFLWFLLYCPAVIAASSHYRVSRFYGLWRHLSPTLFRVVYSALGGAAVLLIGGTLAKLLTQYDWITAGILASMDLTLFAIAFGAAWSPEPRPVQARPRPPERPNILMIGSDTLRADRLGIAGYSRSLTPTLDALAARGTWFENCYVPCGRTAPSLLSLLTGTWPHTHGVRDNFVEDSETRLKVPALPKLLAEQGYRTAAVSDWCGADLGKFNLGFQDLDLPADAWNLRYLLRQGPKDLRLFLSLFMRNRLGKWVVPEVYYLGGVPLTTVLGRDARLMLNRLARDKRPFLLNVFFSTTHPPFGSEYPYYTLFSERDYAGESKFVMARLADPFDIIRRQGEPRQEFDLDQILNLYDGGVKRFDDEVARLVDHLKACDLDQNTIIVIYSDHGMEFFEHETWGQGNSVLGDHSARIPLIVTDPRQKGGHRIATIVRTVDVAPTLLNLVGQAAHPDMEGISLAACIKGIPPPDLPAYNESGIWLTDLPGMPVEHLRYPDLFELLDIPDRYTGTLAIKETYRDIVIQAKDRMIRQGHWKLTYHPLRNGVAYRLFDLQNDSSCRYDVSAANPQIVAMLKERLAEWLRKDNQGDNSIKAIRGLPVPRDTKY